MTQSAIVPRLDRAYKHIVSRWECDRGVNRTALAEHDYEHEHQEALVQAQRPERRIDVFEMNVERTKTIDFGC